LAVNYGSNLVLEDFKISQSLAKFQNNFLYSWYDLAGKQCWLLLFISMAAVIWSLTDERYGTFSSYFFL
jgi:hypothetical protein